MGQVKLWPDRAGLVGKLVKLSSIVIFSHTGNMWQGCVCLKNSATFHEWEIREPLLFARKGGFPCPLMRELSSCSSENWRSSENEIIFKRREGFYWVELGLLEASPPLSSHPPRTRLLQHHQNVKSFLCTEWFRNFRMVQKTFFVFSWSKPTLDVKRKKERAMMYIVMTMYGRDEGPQKSDDWNKEKGSLDVARRKSGWFKNHTHTQLLLVVICWFFSTHVSSVFSLFNSFSSRTGGSQILAGITFLPREFMCPL